MRFWIRRIHMYAGLLSFSVLLVYGISGLVATFSGEGPPKWPVKVDYIPFRAPADGSDKEVADAVYRQLKPFPAGPVPAYALAHDRDNNLDFSFWSSNGTRHVTVLEKENRLRVETRRNDLWHYFNNLHTATDIEPDRHWLVRLWGYYNQFGIAALLWLAVSGLYLWLVSRPRFRPAQLTLAAGVAAFVILYIYTR